jgi:hypothetical protein
MGHAPPQIRSAFPVCKRRTVAKKAPKMNGGRRCLLFIAVVHAREGRPYASCGEVSKWLGAVKRLDGTLCFRIWRMQHPRKNRRRGRRRIKAAIEGGTIKSTAGLRRRQKKGGVYKSGQLALQANAKTSLRLICLSSLNRPSTHPS